MIDRAMRCARCGRAMRESRSFEVSMPPTWWCRVCERCGLWLMLSKSPLQGWVAVDGEGATAPEIAW